MRKKLHSLLFFAFLYGAVSYSKALYVVRVSKQPRLASYLPHSTHYKRDKFKKYCMKTKLNQCKRCCSIPLLRSQNSGNMWPTERRKLIRRILEKVEDDIRNFPSCFRKKKAIQNLQDRISHFKIINVRGNG